MLADRTNGLLFHSPDSVDNVLFRQLDARDIRANTCGDSWLLIELNEFLLLDHVHGLHRYQLLYANQLYRSRDLEQVTG